MKLDNNHITYQAFNVIQRLIKPLAEIADINHFCYTVDYPDGSGFCLLTHPELYNVVLENEFPLEGFYLEKGWHTWKGNLPHDQILEYKKINLCDGVINIIANENKTESFRFATTPENNKMYDFCLNNRHILKKFSAYFLNEAEDLIEIANDQRVTPPPNMREKNPKVAASKKKQSLDAQALINFPFNLLSPMQANCLKLMLYGYTNTEIGKMFDLSSKTIDSYIARIKYKLNARSKVEFIQKAKELGVMEHYFELE